MKTNWYNVASLYLSGSYFMSLGFDGLERFGGVALLTMALGFVGALWGVYEIRLPPDNTTK